ncbi:cobyrinate a,c-diamide synthase [Butyrivibrio sp. CB08]|uniref:cobyrinate a,c-diamide synthase n=1 Tax=Butyrivibrio sp. CB08 TaxID=2364879 RepID=UPI000EA9227E|nr:cobyrinate a,c-diamide synthase [Butyrivibrio sp. CB08]RKM59754.1 cobyrinate a,c-diamide synthase [Butyrivibrio sp. CB08]
MRLEDPRILICAPGSGSGKTLITCGILRLLQKRGLKPAGFKCGPDYIDPMFHKKVLGIPSENLDLFLAGSEGVLQSMAEGAKGRDISVIEGVMGFYDGMGSCSMEGSSYDLCVKTGTPAIMVVNCRGMSRSVIPLIKGFSEYGVGVIEGIILNNISPMIASDIAAEIKRELGIPTIAVLPKLKGELLGSRHLGLIMPDEVPEVLDIIDYVATELEKSFDYDTFMEIAGSAKVMDVTIPELSPVTDKAVGIAMDEAFCFYYEDNLRFLEKLGARIKFFSPIHDEHLPKAHGYIFGGGYPELYLKALSENESMRREIKQAADSGVPILAECGGFLYLKESFIGVDGAVYDMAGVLPGQGFMTEKLGHFGYVNVTAKEDTTYLKAGRTVRGHEFHYCDTTDNGDLCEMSKPTGSRSWEGYQAKNNVFAGFAHLYYPSCPEFIEEFLRKI